MTFFAQHILKVFSKKYVLTSNNTTSILKNFLINPNEGNLFQGGFCQSF